MIRNRAFDDSLYPDDLIQSGDDLTNEGGWLYEYQRGEGQKRWKERLAPTNIPAWYSENAMMRLDQADTLNEFRQAALEIIFEEGGCVWNVGFSGIAVKAGESYHMFFFWKGGAGDPNHHLYYEGR